MVALFVIFQLHMLWIFVGYYLHVSPPIALKPHYGQHFQDLAAGQKTDLTGNGVKQLDNFLKIAYNQCERLTLNAKKEVLQNG